MTPKELLESGMIKGNAHLLPNVAFYAIRAENFDKAIAALDKPCVWTLHTPNRAQRYYTTSCDGNYNPTQIGKFCKGCSQPIKEKK